MSGSSTPPEIDKALFDQVGPALSRLRRRTGGRGDLTRNLVLNVVADAPGEITVGAIAAEMGVSQPVVSRTIAACIADGLLRRAASQADGRRTVLELTHTGESERQRFASEQRVAFERITATWDSAERVQFAQFLIRYSQDASAWSAEQTRRRGDRPGSRPEPT
ncbi:MarR family transcriptional regulator [Lentzea guizhouensis]|uniref:MarR family transcriptional regulator n=1 Tax=Lentzea guizhouensis TaxID=1586287 RepID=A0A1B2HQ64_9PSEU|nr:MarR family winged helix-turn-helix transcriptional regulator [Lentzea guizhouensis]ANZ39845.1 MarR family transcriptional regulator [Lentzea guizhouensis]